MSAGTLTGPPAVIVPTDHARLLAARATILTRDIRLTMFAVIFALGALHHELQFILEQQQAGPFADYLDVWRRVRPTVDWSSNVGVALHLGNVALSLAILVLPWRRGLLCCLAITFVLSNLAMSERIAAHNSLMAGGLLIILLMGAGEALEQASQRGKALVTRTDWLRWTIVGLLVLVTLTYLFAAFHKLNTAFFSPERSTASTLLLSFLRSLGLTSEAAPRLLGYPVIIGTIATELCLPLLLFLRRTRLAGCLLGLTFHLPMMAQGVMDFPVVILAFYVLFMTPAEAQGLLDRLRSRPAPGRFLGALLMTAAGMVALRRAPHVRALYVDAPGSDPVVLLIHTLLLGLTFAFFAYVAAMIMAMMFSHRTTAIEMRAREAVS